MTTCITVCVPPHLCPSSLRLFFISEILAGGPCPFQWWAVIKCVSLSSLSLSVFLNQAFKSQSLDPSILSLSPYSITLSTHLFHSLSISLSYITLSITLSPYLSLSSVTLSLSLSLQSLSLLSISLLSPFVSLSFITLSTHLCLFLISLSLSVLQEVMPFAVVGSDKEYQVNGKRVLGRKTAWGIVEGV